MSKGILLIVILLSGFVAGKKFLHADAEGIQASPPRATEHRQ